jgi:RES domain-containing protein
MVYTAESQSLAVLEMAVHLDSSGLLDRYVVIEVGIDESLVETVQPSELPRNWRDDPPPMKLRQLGDRWIAERASAALQVPSVLIPAEHNFLLNPRHSDFARLVVGKPSALRFDRRLAR